MPASLGLFPCTPDKAKPFCMVVHTLEREVFSMPSAWPFSDLQPFPKCWGKMRLTNWPSIHFLFEALKPYQGSHGCFRVEHAHESIWSKLKERPRQTDQEARAQAHPWSTYTQAESSASPAASSLGASVVVIDLRLRASVKKMPYCCRWNSGQTLEEKVRFIT